jgi:hypothetical protein
MRYIRSSLSLGRDWIVLRRERDRFGMSHLAPIEAAPPKRGPAPSLEFGLYFMPHMEAAILQCEAIAL